MCERVKDTSEQLSSSSGHFVVREGFSFIFKMFA